MTSPGESVLKICFIVTDVISFNVLCRDQLEYLAHRRRFECHYICGGSADGIGKLVDRNVGTVYPVGLVRRPALLRDIGALIGVVRVLRTLDVSVVVYSTPKAMLLGALASLITGKRVRVALVRGRVYEQFEGLKRRFFELLDYFALGISTHCIFISDSLKQSAIGDGVATAGKSVVLGSGSSNGVDPLRFGDVRGSGKQAARARLGIQESGLVVVTVGRFCVDKGALDLQRICLSLKSRQDIQFICVGPIEDELAGRAITTLEAEGNFRYFAAVENPSEFFVAADLHLFLSHREGFGNVAIEAAASGVPTVAYDVIGVRDSVKAGVSGALFDFGDVEAVQEFILGCAEDKSVLHRNYSGAREWAVKNFSRELVCENYANFFEMLIRAP